MSIKLVGNNISDVGDDMCVILLLDEEFLLVVSEEIISLIDWVVLAGILDLQQELDSLDWSDEDLGNGG